MSEIEKKLEESNERIKILENYIAEKESEILDLELEQALRIIKFHINLNKIK